MARAPGTSGRQGTAPVLASPPTHYRAACDPVAAVRRIHKRAPPTPSDLPMNRHDHASAVTAPDEVHETVRLTIPDMHCASCVSRVEQALMKLPEVEAVTVNLAGRAATVRLKAPVATEKLVEAVRAAGYTARIADADQSHAARRLIEEARRQWRNRAAWGAVALSVVAVLWAGSSYAPRATAILTVVVATLAQVILGAPYYRDAFARLRHLGTSMDTLVALGTTAAYGVGGSTSGRRRHSGTSGIHGIPSCSRTGSAACCNCIRAHA